MKFGCVCAVENMAALADVGLAFAETDAGALYPTLDDEAFRRARQSMLAEPLFPEVIRIPDLVLQAECSPDMPGAGGNGESDDSLDLRTTFRRAALVGCRVIVADAPRYDHRHRFNGQGGAWEQALGAVSHLCEQAALTGVGVALRPTDGPEGVAETLEETWVLAEEVGHPAVGVVADVGMVADPADMGTAGPALRHVYLPLPRRFGGDFDTTTCYEAVAALAEFGYAGRISIDADWSAISGRAVDLLDELMSLARSN